MVDSKISRYYNTKRYGDFIEELDFIIYPSINDTQVVVQYEEDGRLDKVAYRVYNNPLFAWVIALRNGILNPMEIKPGYVLYCPDLVDLSVDGGILNP